MKYSLNDIVWTACHQVIYGTICSIIQDEQGWQYKLLGVDKWFREEDIFVERGPAVELACRNASGLNKIERECKVWKKELEDRAEEVNIRSWFIELRDRKPSDFLMNVSNYESYENDRREDYTNYQVSFDFDGNKFTLAKKGYYITSGWFQTRPERWEIKYHIYRNNKATTIKELVDVICDNLLKKYEQKYKELLAKF